MTALKFGRPIKKEDADILFDRHMDIKKRSVGKIREALGDDEEAIRFYCGREGFGINDDLAFLFDKSSLIPLMNNILLGKADGFVLFHGTRAKEDNLDENGNPTDISGRPTLILFPYKEVQTQINGMIQSAIVNILSDGEEHPGTGSSTDTNLHIPETISLPEMFEPGEFHNII